MKVDKLEAGTTYEFVISAVNEVRMKNIVVSNLSKYNSNAIIIPHRSDIVHLANLLRSLKR